MKYHVIAAMAALLFSGTLAAQAILNLSGDVVSRYETWQAIEVDHGQTAQSLTLDLSINATNGSGIAVSLIDLDELATNGSSTATVSGSDPGTGTINLTLNTAMHAGVVEYVITIHTLGSIQTNYVATFGASTLAAGSITLGQIGGPRWPGERYTSPLLDRGVQTAWDSKMGSGLYLIHEIDVDFGNAPHSVSFSFSIDGSVNATAQLWEVRKSKPDVCLVTLAHGGIGSTETNGFTTVRAGKVRMLVTLWQHVPGQTRVRTLFHSGLEVTDPHVFTGRACGGACHSGCSTGDKTNLAWLGLLGLLGVVGVASRLRA